MNEAFNSYSAAILLQLQDIFPYQTPVLGKSRAGWNATTGSFGSNIYRINGGVVILSRHDIVDQRQYIYQATHPTTWDAWANKGAAYAKVMVNACKTKKVAVHVLGTHLQADEGHVPHTETHEVRMAQLREMRQFLQNDLQLPVTERVIIGGDLNVEYTTDAFRRDLETHLQTTIYYKHSMPGSFSAPSNNMTLANARANRQAEDRNETLDYVLVPAGYSEPVKEPLAAVVPLKATEQWYWSYLAQEKLSNEGMTSDLSDHFPVVATFEFEL